MKQKNKRGDGTWLASKTLDLVIAVVVILFLVYLAYLLYGIVTENNEKKQASSSLNEIIQSIKALKEGGESNKLVFSPKDWYIVAYDEGVTPYQCEGKACLCICLSEEAENSNDESYFYKEGLKECDKGACKISEEKIEINRMRQKIDYPGEEIKTTWIPIFDVPIEIKIKKENDKIILNEEK